VSPTNTTLRDISSEILSYFVFFEKIEGHVIHRGGIHGNALSANGTQGGGVRIRSKIGQKSKSVNYYLLS
jgi:hypothetical protein